MTWIWVFNGANGAIPSGIFTERDIAEKQLTGMLTKYPLDIGLYDWAVENDIFTAKREDQKGPHFKQTFTCASLEHYHYENGEGD